MTGNGRQPKSGEPIRESIPQLFHTENGYKQQTEDPYADRAETLRALFEISPLSHSAEITGPHELARVPEECALTVIADHNVVDCIPGLPPKQRAEVTEHLASRGPGHCIILPLPDPDKNYNITMLIPNIDPTQPGIGKLLEWWQENLGIKFAISSADNSGATNLQDARLQAINPETLDTPQVTIPYLVTPDQPPPFWGPDPKAADEFKDKATFHKILMQHQDIIDQILKAFNLEGNAVLPYETAKGEDLEAVIKKQLSRYEQMYRQVANQLQENGHQSEAARLETELTPGVVVRLTESGGAYGMFTIKKESDDDNQTYTVTVDGETQNRFESLEALLTSLQHVIQSEQQYIVTRLIQIDSSPSIGVMFSGDRCRALPPTSQLMNESQCIGGGSTPPTQQLPPHIHHAISLISEMLVHQHHCRNTIPREGHIGFDFMRILRGSAEELLTRTVLQNPGLAHSPIDSERSDLGTFRDHVASLLVVAESNPRMTALTGAAVPATRKYLLSLPPDQRPPTIRIGDLMMMYGYPDTEGNYGGFFTIDYLRSSYIDNVERLTTFIDRFNRTFEQLGIFLHPKLPIETTDNPNENLTAITVAIQPTDNPLAHKLFNQIRTIVERTASLDDIIAIYRYIASDMTSNEPQFEALSTYLEAQI